MGRWLARLREQADDARHHGARDDDAAELAPRRGKSSATMPQAPHGMALTEGGGCDVPPPTVVSGPGVRIVPPAVEVSAAEYDRHLDALIAAAGVGTPEARRLAYAKRKGWVVPRGEGRIFARGR